MTQHQEHEPGLQARDVAVRRRHTWLLPPTTLTVSPGEVTLAVGEPDERHALLSLAVAGRLAGAEGEVHLDGRVDQRGLQRHVVLVDIDGVTAPEPVLPVGAVVGEELAMSGERAWSRHVARWLVRTAPGVDPAQQVGDLEPATRLDLLTRLALLRRPRFVVIGLPERHGTLPEDWWPVAGAVAARGPGVLVTASPTAAAHLDVAPARAAVMGGSRPVDPTEVTS